MSKTADRFAEGRAAQKLDLANRCQERADEHLAKGDIDKADFFQDLAADALANYYELIGGTK